MARELLGRFDHLRWMPVDTHQLSRDLDLARVSPDLLAVAEQQIAMFSKGIKCPVRIPAIGCLCNQPEAAWALCPQPDRRSFGRCWTGNCPSGVQRKGRTVEVEPFRMPPRCSLSAQRSAPQPEVGVALDPGSDRTRAHQACGSCAIAPVCRCWTPPNLTALQFANTLSVLRTYKVW